MLCVLWNAEHSWTKFTDVNKTDLKIQVGVRIMACEQCYQSQE